MGAPSIGEVVLIPFPFSDLSQTKVRPVVCLADAGMGDWILCQVTSNPYGDAAALPLVSSDFEAGGLLVECYARPGKLFTAHRNLLIKSVGKLNDSTLDRLVNAVIRVLQPNPTI